MMLTSKYQWALQLAQSLIPDYGRTATVFSPVNSVAGQQSPEVLDSFETPIFRIDSIFGRGTRQVRADRGQFLMPATNNRSPRPGDIIRMHNGREYIVEMVSTLEPDSVAIMYEVFVADG